VKFVIGEIDLEMYNIMASHKNYPKFYMERHKMELRSYRELSENEQMYLVTIAKLQENGGERLVPLSDLAETLSFLPVSVNQMIRKLADDGLLEYQPYKGVDFSPAGREIVLRILRYRRLWEVFLVKHLNFDLDEADALACRMEHITNDRVADRLSGFLGNPQVCYHGHTIPSPGGKYETVPQIALNKLSAGEVARVRGIMADPAAVSFLRNEDLQPGSQVRVLGIGDGGAMLLEVNDHQINLSAGIASQVVVEAEFTENRSGFPTPGDQDGIGR